MIWLLSMIGLTLIVEGLVIYHRVYKCWRFIRSTYVMVEGNVEELFEYLDRTRDLDTRVARIEELERCSRG